MIIKGKTYISNGGHKCRFEYHLNVMIRRNKGFKYFGFVKKWYDDNHYFFYIYPLALHFVKTPEII